MPTTTISESGRRYRGLSAEERRVLVARLLDQRRTAGLSAEEVSRAAQQVGVSERTLWRWLAGDLPGGRRRSRYRLTEADRDAYRRRAWECRRGLARAA